MSLFITRKCFASHHIRGSSGYRGFDIAWVNQTNVYPSAQRRKLREFDGYRRVCVVIVTDEDTYKERQKRREEADGKEVPDGAIMDMKGS